jgi:quercetin dioxygenase-like cupin family protein
MMRPVRWHARSTVLVTLVISGVALMIGAGSAQQQGRGQGEGPGAGRGGFASNFTGTISVVDSAEMRMSRIRFEAGARTNWHVHSTGQLLLIEEGRGRLQELGEEVRELVAGQPVYTKPNILHWHGAAPDQPAVQFSVYSGTLEWKEPVSDDEYSGRQRRQR